VLLLTNKDQQ